MQAVATKTSTMRPDFCNLHELPRTSGLMLADLGIGVGEYQLLCRTAATNPTHAKRLDVVREVLFELMKRDREQRLRHDDFGELPTVPATGANGQAVKAPLYEFDDVSKWDVRDEGGDCHIGGAGPARVKPKPGHWRKYILEHWATLAPTLMFRDPSATAPHGDPAANPETYRAAVQWSVSNENPDRVALLKWLKPFLKAAKPSDWTGDGKQTASSDTADYWKSENKESS